MGYQQKSYKKFVATAATATLVASAIVPVASAAGFSDVSENSEFAPFINALVEEGIINGYASDNTFRPNNKLTRGQVAIMLGRWLENNGEIVPTDWNTVQRFNDVPVNATTASGKELAKYAALVKETGVFTGVLGSLNPGQNITRENMAVVLDRVSSAVTGFSLVEVAEEIEDVTVADLNTAQAAYQDEIQALADLGITTVSNFRPKEQVSRAQFAKFLYTTFEVIEEVLATPATADELKAEVASIVGTLPAVNTITVDNAAAAKATATEATTALAEVEKVVAEGEYTEAEVTELNKVIADAKTAITAVNTKADEVIEAAKAPVVESIQAVNGSQLVVKFNQPINVEDVVTTSGDVTTLNANILTKNDVAVAGSTYVATVSEDKKSVTILADNTGGSGLVQNWDGYYTVKLLDGKVKSAAGKYIPEAKFTINTEDKTAPTVTSVTKTSATSYRVNFSEPIADAGALQATYKASGLSATADLTVVDTNMAKGYIDIRITGASVQNGAVINLSWLGVQDYSGNVTAPNPLALEITKGEKDGVAPTVTSIKTTALNKFEIEFSEEVNLSVSQIKIAGNALVDGTTAGQTPAQAKLVQDKADKKKYTVTLADVKSSGDIISVSIDKGVTDLSGEVLSTTADYVKAIQFNNDVTAPTLVSSAVKKDVSGKEFLHLVFDETVTLTTPATASAKMVYNGVTSIGTLATAVPSAVTGTDNKEWKIELGNASTQFTSTTPSAAAAALVNNATYTFDLAGLATDLAGNAIDTKQVTFTRGTDTSAVTQSVTAIGQGSTNSEIEVTFANNVDVTTATNIANYTVQGAVVEKAEVIAGSLNKVVLTIKDGSNTQTGSRNVTVSGVKTAAGENMTKVHTEAVTLTENVAPKFTATLTANNTIVLKFTEAVTASTTGTGVIDENDFVVYVDDVAVAASIVDVNFGTSVDTLTVTLGTALTDLSKKVEVSGKAGNDVVDAEAVVTTGAAIVGNKLGTSKVTVSK